MTSSPIRSKLRRMVIGASLFALVLLGMAAAFPSSSPPVSGLVILAAVFSLSFAIFGEPLRFLPWRDGDRAGIWLSYVVSAMSCATVLYVTWALHSWSQAQTAA
jgi:hypothetical protein